MDYLAMLDELSCDFKIEVEWDGTEWWIDAKNADGSSAGIWSNSDIRGAISEAYFALTK